MGSKPLINKVALVTGATRGLGKGIAVGLAEAGAAVYITGRSLQPDDSDEGVSGSLLETQAAIEKVGGVCIPVQVDHADDEQVRSLFEQIETEQNGQLDILVNNVYAGVRALRNANGQPFWKSEPSLWDACNNVGLRSHYIASVYAARLMTARKQGLICTLSSWGGLSYIFGVAYGAGKSACDRMAADMALELKPYNVTSLSLWPGIVGTEHISQFVDELNAATEPSEPSEQTSETTDEAVLNPALNTRSALLKDRFNWETPLLAGRAIAALAADPDRMRYTGHLQIVAEVARRYGVVDQDGKRPVSLRSLRFILPFALPALRKNAGWIPDFQIPWWLLMLVALSSPKIR
ncbi:MAG: SDR family NAD(P)-dependent oxidoreductase [Thainema sp.]